MKKIHDTPMTSTERSHRFRAWLHLVAKRNGFNTWYELVGHISKETKQGREVVVSAPEEIEQ